MPLSRHGSRPGSPNVLNEDLYEQFERTHGNEKNPYNLGAFSNQQINMIKAGLKWEEGNWSTSDMKTLRKKLMYFFVRKQAHWDFAINYNEYAKYLEIPKIILSSVLSTSLFVNATDNNNFSNTMQFINAGLGTTVAILVGIDSYAKFSEIYNRHKNTSLEYSKLCAKIERLLQAKPEERQSFSIVLSKIDERYEKIREEAPFISQEFLDEFIDLLENEYSCYEYVDSSLKTKIRNNTAENTTNGENISEHDEELVSLTPPALRNVNDLLSTVTKSINKPVPEKISTATKSDIENQIT